MSPLIIKMVIIYSKSTFKYFFGGNIVGLEAPKAHQENSKPGNAGMFPQSFNRRSGSPLVARTGGSCGG